jgi:hypothetical protein
MVRLSIEEKDSLRKTLVTHAGSPLDEDEFKRALEILEAPESDDEAPPPADGPLTINIADGNFDVDAALHAMDNSPYGPVARPRPPSNLWKGS